MIPYNKMFAQEETNELASILPVNNFVSDSVDQATLGVKIFSDRSHVFLELPSFLSKKGFLKSSMDNGITIKPTTKGILYMVTPLEGQPYSQEKLLISEGFIKIEHPSFNLFQNQVEKIGVFKKSISDNKFTAIRVKGWAVPFFSPTVLPSIAMPAEVIWSPGEEYNLTKRLWQGCPSIEKTRNRLWAAWFSGGRKEPDEGNHGVVSYSDNEGNSWIDPAMVIVHPDKNVRVMDTQIWKDPSGMLWIFWTQNTGTNSFDGIWGTWAIRIDNPDAQVPSWTAPRRLCDGLTRNKPTVLSTGEWLLPSYNWINNQSGAYISKDQGETWKLQGGAFNESRNFYEHMFLELKDGRIWMLQRNIKETYSNSKGINWTELRSIAEFTSANSRLFIRRLSSGNLLLVYNDDPEGKVRKNLTAFLSSDEGKTWPYKLILDERAPVSYPDAIQDENGLIYLTYDRSRTGDKEILLTTFTEDDIVAGEYISKQAQQKKILSKVP